MEPCAEFRVDEDADQPGKYDRSREPRVATTTLAAI
jgi:hypothetical protein